MPLDFSVVPPIYRNLPLVLILEGGIYTVSTPSDKLEMPPTYRDAFVGTQLLKESLKIEDILKSFEECIRFSPENCMSDLLMIDSREVNVVSDNRQVFPRYVVPLGITEPYYLSLRAFVGGTVSCKHINKNSIFWISDIGGELYRLETTVGIRGKFLLEICEWREDYRNNSLSLSYIDERAYVNKLPTLS